MALEGAAKLKEVPLSDVPISTPSGLTESDGVKWEAVKLLLRFQEMRVDGVRVLRGRQELPARSSREKHLHAGIKRVRGCRKRGLIE